VRRPSFRITNGRVRDQVPRVAFVKDWRILVAASSMQIADFDAAATENA